MPVVPAVVYVEWWRGRTDLREEILAAVIVEAMPSSLCRAAGEALRAMKGTSLADAVVMASAALRGGGIVYSSDVNDLQRPVAALTGMSESLGEGSSAVTYCAASTACSTIP